MSELGSGIWYFEHHFEHTLSSASRYNRRRGCLFTLLRKAIVVLSFATDMRLHTYISCKVQAQGGIAMKFVNAGFELPRHPDR